MTTTPIDQLLRDAVGDAELARMVYRSIVIDGAKRRLGRREAKQLNVNQHGTAVAHAIAALAAAMPVLDELRAALDTDPDLVVETYLAMVLHNSAEFDPAHMRDLVAAAWFANGATESLTPHRFFESVIIDGLSGVPRSSLERFDLFGLALGVQSGLTEIGERHYAPRLRAALAEISSTPSATHVLTAAAVEHTPQQPPDLDCEGETAPRSLRANAQNTATVLDAEWLDRLGRCPRDPADIVTEIGGYDFDYVVPAQVAHTAMAFALHRVPDHLDAQSLVATQVKAGWIAGAILAGANPARGSHLRDHEVPPEALNELRDLADQVVHLWDALELSALPPLLGSPGLECVTQLAAVADRVASHSEDPTPLPKHVRRALIWEATSLGIALTRHCMPG